MVDSHDNMFVKNRPSTRVRAAPGGGSSICFGSEGVCAPKVDIQPPKPAGTQLRELSLAGAPPKIPVDEGIGSRTGVMGGGRVGDGEGGRGGRGADMNMSSNPPGRNSNGRGDPKTSIKVHQPPGGRSSIHFG